MKWARVNKAYLNLDLIVSFYWSCGKLFIWHIGDTEPEWYADHNRENYFRLCLAAGVRPIEEDACGQD